MKLLLFIKKSMFFVCRRWTLILICDPFNLYRSAIFHILQITFLPPQSYLKISLTFYLPLKYILYVYPTIFFLWKSFNTSNNKIYFLDILTFLIHNDKIINVRLNMTPLPSLSLCLFVKLIIAVELIML